MKKLVSWTTQNIWKVILLTEVLFLVIAVSLKISTPPENYDIPIMSGSPDIGELYAEGGYYTFDQDEDAVAAMELNDYIPFHLSIPVKAGSYTVTINYKSSSVSMLRLFSKESKLAVQCDDFMLYENKEQLSSNFIVKQDISDLDVCVKYGGHGYFDVHSVSIQGNHKDVLPFVVKCTFLFLVFNFLLFLKKKNYTIENCEHLRIGFTILAFATIASLPLFVGFLPIMDDWAMHFVRIEGIKDALLEGQLPALIMPNSLMGYGYADPVFYPNLPLYIPACMRIIGFSFMESYKTFVFIINLLTAFISYYAVSKIFSSKHIGLFGSFIYTFSIYRLVDLYRRAATGEFWAIAFMPLVVYGIYKILVDDTEEIEYKQSWIPLTIGLWGMTNGHLLSCEMIALFLIPICLICIKRVLNKKRIVQFVKAGCITFLLWIYFLIPFISMSLQDSYKVFTEVQTNVADNAISFFQTFSLFFSQVGNAVGYTEGTPPRDLGIGFVFLLGIILFVFLKRRKTEHTENQFMARNAFCWLCLLFGFIAIWMTTYHFPWTRIGNMNIAIQKILFMVQFPWRYTAIATVLLLFVMCEIVRMLFHDQIYGEGTNRFLGCAYVSTIVILVLVQTLFYFQTVPREGVTLYYYEEAGLPMSEGIGYGEYEPVEFNDVKIGQNIWQLQETFENAGNDIEIVEFEKHETDSVLTVNNFSEEAQNVYLPILYYPGYEAFDLFSDTPLELFKSSKGTVGIKIPGIYASAVKVEYHPSLLYRIGYLISITTMICLLIYVYKSIVKRRHSTL